MVALTGIDLVKPDSAVACSSGFLPGSLALVHPALTSESADLVACTSPKPSQTGPHGVVGSRSLMEYFDTNVSLVTSFQESVLLTMLRPSRDDPFSGFDHLLFHFRNQKPHGAPTICCTKQGQHVAFLGPQKSIEWGFVIHVVCLDCNRRQTQHGEG